MRGTRRRLIIWRLIYALLGCFVILGVGPVVLWRYSYDQTLAQQRALQAALQSEIAMPAIRLMKAYIEPPLKPYSPSARRSRRDFVQRYGMDHVLFVFMKDDGTSTQARELLAVCQQTLADLGRRERWDIRVYYGPRQANYRRARVEGMYEPRNAMR